MDSMTDNVNNIKKNITQVNFMCMAVIKSFWCCVYKPVFVTNLVNLFNSNNTPGAAAEANQMV